MELSVSEGGERGEREEGEVIEEEVRERKEGKKRGEGVRREGH